MMILPTNVDSRNIMHLIKEDTVGAEIGVWRGNTAKLFAQKKPKELHLVDPYSVEPYKENSEMSFDQWIAKYSELTNEFSEAGFMRYYDIVFKDVKRMFEGNDAVKLYRETSDEWFANNQDIELDWIYIDGDHSYEGCLRDLNNAFKVVKKGGLILGDDFRWPNSRWWKDGVTDAVNNFLETNTQLQIKRHGETQYKIVVK